MRDVQHPLDLAMLRSGGVRADALIPHRFTSEEYDAALDVVASTRTCLKAVVAAG